VDCLEERTLEWDAADFDVAVIGTNGVSAAYGCTTTTPSEAVCKRNALLRAKRRFVMAETSKYGVWQSEQFANFEDQIEIVTAVDVADPRVDELIDIVAGGNSTVHVISM
jgi:DeoR family fructose operon transcriptional repressor